MRQYDRVLLSMTDNVRYVRLTVLGVYHAIMRDNTGFYGKYEHYLTLILPTLRCLTTSPRSPAFLPHPAAHSPFSEKHY